MKWNRDYISKLMDLLKDTRPLYLFMDEQERVLDCQWFATHAEAMRHAQTLDAPIVNILIYVGSAENENESYFFENKYSPNDK